jgi:hypothetical protein
MFGPRRRLRPAAQYRHGSREVAPQPTGGGVAPRIPAVNADAARDVMRAERTMHETRAGLLVGRATSRHKLALDDMHPIIPALITDTLPKPVMVAPQIACGPSPGGLFASGSRQSERFCIDPQVAERRSPYWNSTLAPILVHGQAINNRSHPPLSVKQNLVTDCARRILSAF